MSGKSTERAGRGVRGGERGVAGITGARRRVPLRHLTALRPQRSRRSPAPPPRAVPERVPASRVAARPGAPPGDSPAVAQRPSTATPLGEDEAARAGYVSCPGPMAWPGTAEVEWNPNPPPRMSWPQAGGCQRLCGKTRAEGPGMQAREEQGQPPSVPSPPLHCPEGGCQR